MEFDFTLRLAVPPTAPQELVDRLGAGGCTDALVGIGRPGRVALNFTRESDSALAAITSAIDDAQRALPGSSLLELTPDFVGLSDVADLVGVTRQNMRKLMLSHVATFPAAIHEGSTALWHLHPILMWLGNQAGYSVVPALIDVAQVAMQINIAKAWKYRERRVQRELSLLVAL
jgi:hypothetical protein